jgi:GntR family transcriptional regulator / MocR family aminotransferase
VTSWDFTIELDRTRDRSLSRQIAHAIAADIHRGRLRPGDRLPGSRTLASMLKVHRQTVTTAIDDLIAEGWLISRRTAGVFVADGLPDLPRGRRLGDGRTGRATATRFTLDVTSAPRPELPAAIEGGTLLMSGTRPDVRLVPADLIGRSYRRALRVCGPALLSYNDPAGLPRLRHQLAIMLATTRGLVVNPESIMITRGSQMALALLARALVRPGDTVAVEQPGYRPAWEAFRLAGAEILPVPVNEHGLDVSALAGRVSRRPIRAVYVTPHHQFPTTVTLAGPRRLQLLDLAARARFALIEDDYDHEFHYTGKPVLPLASHDRVGVVAYVGTMSKVLAPGLRLGFIAAPPNLIEQLVAYRSFVDLQGDHVLEAAIADLLEDGLIQRHARKMRRVYRARLDTLATSLRRRLGPFLAFRKPEGGTAIWVRVRAAHVMAEWTRAAREKGVLFDAGHAFTVRGAPVTGARLGFASLTEEELERAVRALAAAAKSVR